MKQKFALLIIALVIGLISCAANNPVKVLMLGGSMHHDYKLCYDKLDRKILEDAGIAEVTYTEDVTVATAALADADVFMACGNVPYDKPMKQAITKFLNRNGGLMLTHAAVWKRKGWPILNTKIVGGIPKGHEPKGKTFDVKIVKPDHPLMKDLPATFEIIDELYRMQHLQEEIKWTVLTESKSRDTGEVYPSIFLANRTKGKVLCCTLGHDQLSHDVPAYQQFLRNAIIWLSKK